MRQKLPTNWEEREKLRNKGQFWTPAWVAQAMVEYVIKDSDLLFDPAAGNGAFYEALKERSRKNGRRIRFYGTDIDENVIKSGFENGIYDPDNSELEVRDFILNPPNRKFKAIIANPPYIRHHRLDPSVKLKLKELSKRIMGFTIDARAGYHIYFLIQALNLLAQHGKLAFIMPADTSEGIFAPKLWEWITKNYYLESVLAFLPEASPFPKVDTNALIYLVSKEVPRSNLYWVLLKRAESDSLIKFVESSFKGKDFSDLEIYERDLQEALLTGLSRLPQIKTKHHYILADFAKVMRGIATGENEFFFLSKKRVRELGLPDEFLRIAIGRTRDIDGDIVDNNTIKNMENADKATLLLYLDGRKPNEFPPIVEQYIRQGEKIGLPKKALIKSRNPWYKMETRKVPEFLFAYLGRRNARFIRNKAQVLPLTGFLCIYPKSDDKAFVEKLWKVLQDPETIGNLKLVGKSYGGGAIKVEPRALDRLPISAEIVEELGLKPIRDTHF